MKWGLWVLLVSIVVLIGTIEPTLEGPAFGLSMALLGVGMGLLASQLGNVVQSSVGPRDRSEAGGLQYTAQQLGSSIGTALIGAVVITVLASVFISQVENDPRIPPELGQEIGVALQGTIEFINAGDLEAGLAETDLTAEEQTAIVDSYAEGQLIALRIGLLVAASVVISALFLARKIPDISFEEIAEAEAEDLPATST